MELVTIKVENHKDIPKNYTGIAEYPDGTRYWLLNGELHRTDGPAVEYPNGTKSWYLNGRRHRTDGPAIEYPDGRRYWYLNGRRHRTDGPAIEFPDGRRYWYLNHKQYAKEEHFQCVAEHYPESIRKLIWNL